MLYALLTVVHKNITYSKQISRELTFFASPCFPHTKRATPQTQDYSHYHECFYILDYRLLLLYVPLKMGIEEQAVETITPEQAAKMLQVTPATIRKWLRKGELAGSETPAGWRITQADIEAWLAKYRREAKDTTA